MRYQDRIDIFIFLGILIITNTRPEQEDFKDLQDKTIKTKVLILGAGVAGVSAASALNEQNISDFVVVEAQSYIGGRAKVVDWNGLTIEAGANWIHHVNDADSAPLLKLKELVGLQGRLSNYSDIAIRSNQHCFHPQHDVIKQFAALLLEFPSVDLEDTCPSSFKNVFKQHNWISSTPLHDIIEYLNIDFESTRPPENVAYYKLDAREDDIFVSDSRGVSALYKPLYSQFESQVHLGVTVASIEYSTSGVVVKTSTGRTYVADYAICTFSSDVILSDVIPTFIPKLPRWKIEAYRKAPMGLYTKIFVKFPRQFWEDNEFILHVSSQRGYYPVIQNVGFYSRSGHGVLLVTVTGSQALRVENQENHQTLQEIMTVLRGLYGHDIPDPIDIYYERWSHNPFTRGAYSESVLGTIQQDYEDMRRNVGRLYFAGEATSKDWYGYMQGAYITGRQAAIEIANHMSCTEKNTCDDEANGKERK